MRVSNVLPVYALMLTCSGYCLATNPVSSLDDMLSDVKRRQEEIQQRIKKEQEEVARLKASFAAKKKEADNIINNTKDFTVEFMKPDGDFAEEEKVFVDYYTYLRQHLVKYIGPIGVANLVKAKFEIEKAFIQEELSDVFGIRVLRGDQVVLFASLAPVKNMNKLLLKKCAILPECDPELVSQKLRTFIKKEFPEVKSLFIIIASISELEKTILNTLGFVQTDSVPIGYEKESHDCYELSV